MTEQNPPQPICLSALQKLVKRNARRRKGDSGNQAANDTRDGSGDTLLTVKEVALICRVHPKTVRTWIKNEELAEVRKGRLIRISRRALDKFLKGK